MNRILMALAAALAMTILPTDAADAPKKPATKGIDLEKAFNTLDSSSNGKLSLEEFKNLKSVILAPKNSPEYKFPDMFKKLDTDKSGDLSLDEFKMVQTVIPKAPETTPKKKKKN
jgi:Ca2+-binding EF-hand superfamily protein